MVKRIYIDNFRCFVNFEYRPEQKQLLLGANGSGKSSLIDAILSVKQFIKGGENLFTQSARTRWQDRPLQIVEIEALLDDKKYEYRVEIRFEPESRKLSLNLESLRVAGKPVFELAKGQLRFFPDGGDQPTAVPFETPKSALHLSLLSNSHVRRFSEWMESVHCFRIDGYPGQMDEEADIEVQQPDYELANLAGWYRYLVGAHPGENASFVRSMREVFDGFQTLRFSSGEDGVKMLRADFQGPTSKRVSYSLSELSDGQRYLLALYMILHFLIAKGKTIFIDEPDNFIALREIQPWLRAAEAAVEEHKAQLILISHHPEVLDKWASRHGLRFFREDNGHVRTERFRPDPDGNLQPSELIARGWEGE